MKQNRIMFAALAIAALFMTACDKEPQGFDSFILGISDFEGANGTKTTWDASGLWWESGDQVLINGTTHEINKNDSIWTTKGSVTNPDPSTGNTFNVAFVGGKTASYSNGKYSDVVFCDVESGEYGCSFVPLAIAGNTNRLTLNPCCAVIKSHEQSHVDICKEDGDQGTESDAYVYANGNINVASATVSDGDPIFSIDAIEGDDGCFYFILPMGDPVRAKLVFDNKETTGAVTITKGVLYIID